MNVRSFALADESYMARVKLDEITCRHGNVCIIDGITFEVPDGQFWVMVGPSGCGKSTILRTIAGLESATAGDVYIGESRMNQIPARQRDIAMVFSKLCPLPSHDRCRKSGLWLADASD
ncbi:ATP-binding cassette domain-containing protein [Neosynechococcus sphagnicola]|uniref:ATP-binding cassette domain-containing protein n=1 Tax=Neosynechococcus sphagnicola TaxID=1501145 RepID=UPI001EF9F7C8|nr:ATP-binding cassette domain-containing protein [Neosynechococcus sphagnicola]